MLAFGNTFDFLGLNWAQRWTKTINFGFVPFPLKYFTFKDYLETVFVL